MKFSSLVALGALGLSACASAAPGMSFIERQEQAALDKIADECSGKTGERYDACARGVRSDLVARYYASLSRQAPASNLGQGAYSETVVPNN